MSLGIPCRFVPRKIFRSVVTAIVLLILIHLYTYFVAPAYLKLDEDKAIRRVILPAIIHSNSANNETSKQIPKDFEEKNFVPNTDSEKNISVTNMTEFWEAVSNKVGKNDLYPADFNVNVVLKKMSSSRIENVTKLKSGTSFKWSIRLEGGQYAIFKPQLVAPGDERKTDCNSGHEQPRSEIAAFHLMRLFEMRTVPFVAGRKVNITSEVLPFASTEVKSVISTYKNGTVCVTAKCLYCDREQRHCFQNGVIDGSLMFWVKQPIRYFFRKESPYHPFHSLSLNKTLNSYGLNDHRHCNYVRTLKLYNNPRYFLDMVDIAIMDHILNNRDQKHVCTVDKNGNPLLTIHIDHGLGFCQIDDLGSNTNRMLFALSQCCRVRKSTITILKKLLPTLKEDFGRATSGDPLYPVLGDSDLDRVMKRIGDVLDTVAQCESVVNESDLYDTVL